MKSVIVTIATKNLQTQEYLNFVWKDLKNYTNIYGIDLIRHEKSLDSSRTPHWSKILAVREAFQKRYDWVIWLDADIKIMNMTLDIRGFIDPNYNLIIGSDCTSGNENYIPNTNHEHSLNSGFFFLKNCNWSDRLLTKVWNDENPYTKDPTMFDWEQGSFRSVVNSFPSEVVQNKIKFDDSFNKFWNFPLNFKVSDLYLNEMSTPWNMWLYDLAKNDMIFKKGDFAAHAAGAGDSRGGIFKSLHPHVIR